MLPSPSSSNALAHALPRARKSSQWSSEPLPPTPTHHCSTCDPPLPHPPSPMPTHMLGNIDPVLTDFCASACHCLWTFCTAGWSMVVTAGMATSRPEGCNRAPAFRLASDSLRMTVLLARPAVAGAPSSDYLECGDAPGGHLASEAQVSGTRVARRSRGSTGVQGGPSDVGVGACMWLRPAVCSTTIHSDGGGVGSSSTRTRRPGGGSMDGRASAHRTVRHAALKPRTRRHPPDLRSHADMRAPALAGRSIVPPAATARR